LAVQKRRERDKEIIEAEE